MANRIYLCLAHMSEDGMEQKYVKEAFDTNWVVPLGPNVDGRGWQGDRDGRGTGQRHERSMMSEG